jgi:hypothetical protein
MTDAIARVRAAVAKRDTAFAAIEQTKQLDYSDSDLHELTSALIDAAPEMLRAVDTCRFADDDRAAIVELAAENARLTAELSAAKAVMKAHEAGGTFACDALQFAVGEAQTRSDIALLNERNTRLRASLGKLLSEIAFVISGGDNPSDKCTECGLAGIGMLRDARTESLKLWEKTKDGLR